MDRERPEGFSPAVDGGWRDRLAAVADALGHDVSPLRLVLSAAVIAAMVVAGAVLLRQPSAPKPEDSLPYAGTAAAAPSPPGAASVASTSTTGSAEVVAHAAGAVVSPGLYRLPAGSRVADLVAAAGGSAADADVDRLNLAAALTDGQRVYVPRRGEEPPAEVGASPGPLAATSQPAATEPLAPIDLNTATAAELEALPGIGPVTARAILEYRDQAGGFRSVDELLEVRGIGEVTLAELRDLITV